MLYYDELKDFRKSPRKNVSKSIYFSSHNKYYEGVIKNLSHGGAFIETQAKFSNGIELKLVLPGPKKYILLKCGIIHFKQTGFGVKFNSLSKIEKFSATKRYGRQLAI